MARKVKIAAGKTNVMLPNGSMYQAGDVVILTNEQWWRVSTAMVPDFVIDEGDQGGEGPVVPAPAAIASADAADDPATGAEFDALRADVVALNAWADDLSNA